MGSRCAIEDDMQKTYKAFIAADIIVFATPMYWGYMTAQTKGVLDRTKAITSLPDKPQEAFELGGRLSLA